MIYGKFKIDNIKSYCRFILTDCLNEFVSYEIEQTRTADLSILKFFKHLSEQEFFDLCKKGIQDTLLDFIEDRAFEAAHVALDKWRNDQVEHLPNHEVEAEEVAYIYSIKKKTFHHFMPRFTQDIQLVMGLVNELEDYYAFRQSLAFKTYAEIHEELKRKNIESLKTLAEASLEAIVIHDNGMVQEANKGLGDLLGTSTEALIGKDLFAFTTEEERIRVRNIMQNGHTMLYETVGVKADGTLFNVEISSREILYKNKKVRVASLRDISQRKAFDAERKRHLEELLKLNEQLKLERDFNQMLLDHSMDRILAFDNNLIITAWNRKMEDEIGVKREDAIGKSFFDLFPMYRGNMQHLDKVWQGEKVFLRDRTFKYKEGYYDSDIVPIIDKDGKIVGALSYARDTTDKKLAELHLKESKYFIQQVADTIPDIIQIYDMEAAKYVYSNREAYNSFGYSAEDLKELGENYVNYLVHPDDLHKVKNRIEAFKHAQDGEILESEHRVKHKNGEYRWVQSRGIVFKRDQKGNVAQYLSIVRDITEKRLSEQKLKRSEALLNESQAIGHIGSFEWDMEKNAIYWTEEHYHICEYPKDAQLTIERIFDMVHPGDKERFMQVFDESFSLGEAELEYRIIVPGGKVKHIWTKAKMYYDDKGNPLRFVGSLQDITTRKNVEEDLQKTKADLLKLNASLEEKVKERTLDLKRNEDQLRLIANNIPAFISYIDHDQTYRFANNYYQHLDYVQGSLVGRKVAEVLGHNYASSEPLIAKVLNEGIMVSYQRQFFLKNDVIKEIELKYVPDKDDEGNVRGFIVMGIDLTERVAIEKALEQKNKDLLRINTDLDNFIYTASHDLKAPISNIEGLILTIKDLLDELALENDELSSMIQMLERSSLRLKNTISDLAEITKVQRDVYGMVEDIDIAAALEDVKESVSEDIITSHAEISVNVEHPVLRFSKVNFKSIIYNLISNALKYRHPDRVPTVTINCRKLNDMILMEVADNGLGIAEQNLPKLFSMFKRFHNHVEGSGIGLYIVKRIVENAGGKVEVSSEPGQGTLFRVFFPV